MVCNQQGCLQSASPRESVTKRTRLHSGGVQVRAYSRTRGCVLPQLWRLLWRQWAGGALVRWTA